MVKTQLILLTALFAFLPLSHTYFNIYKTQSVQDSRQSSYASDSALTAYQRTNKTEVESIEITSKKSARKYSPNYRIKKVVIDPGHGGHDSGCSGSASTEKHIALSIAKKMKVAMEAQHPDIQVILTRNRDVFIPLKRRADIANEIQADLFISIHCNSIRNANKVNGSETYVLGAHKMKENLDVAKRENASVLFEDNYAQTYNFDPNSDAGHITMSLYQNAYLEQSLLFASQVEKNVKENTALRSRGVKQAGFLVLRETTMPSVLIETGYLTSSKDQAYLNSVAGQNRMARVITQAFSEYKAILEKGAEGENLVVRPKMNSPSQGGTPYRRPEFRPNTSNDAVVIVPQKQNKTTRQITKSVPSAPPVTSVPVPSSGIQYRVQLAAADRALDTSKGRWTRVSEYLIEVVREKGLLKYQARGFYSFAEANQARKVLGTRGFKGAWVVAYKNGEKISIKQAKAELGEY